MSERQHPLAALTKTRLLEFVREPEALFWVFAFPIIMALVLGFAFRDRPPDPVPVGVVTGPSAAELLRALSRPGTVSPASYPSVGDGLEALRTGKITVLVVEEPGSLVYHFDRTRPDARIARLEVDDAIQRSRGRRDPSPAREALVHDKGSRYIDFLLPGILGLNLMGTGIWGIGFSIVNARLKKTLKLMVATPMRKSHYLLAQMLSRFVFLVLEVAVILAFGVAAFQVPVRGSLALVGLVTVLGALCFGGIGILVAARARTLEAANGLMNLVMVPMWLLSGVFFSSERFPRAAQPLIQALPLTALNNALRAVMLEGRALPAIAAELAIVAAWGAVAFVAGLEDLSLAITGTDSGILAAQPHPARDACGGIVMETLVVSQAEVPRFLSMKDCIEVMARAFGALARGEGTMPQRQIVWLPGRAGALGLMPAHLNGLGAVGVKAVTFFPRNEGTELDSHQGAVLLFEAGRGRLLAVIDATSVTAVRTAAVTALATRLLSREDAGDLALVGSGVQARTHLEAMLLVRRIRRVRVASKTLDNARAFAEREAKRHGLAITPCASVREAVEGADIVCALTSSREPVVRGEWLAPGAHVNAVGSSVASARELDAAAVSRARLFVDRREAALAEAGDFLLAREEGAVTDAHILAELGEIVVGSHPGRTGPAEITLFKSVGLAIEDLAAAQHIYGKARASGSGNFLEFGGGRHEAD